MNFVMTKSGESWGILLHQCNACNSCFFLQWFGHSSSYINKEAQLSKAGAAVDLTGWRHPSPKHTRITA